MHSQIHAGECLIAALLRGSLVAGQISSPRAGVKKLFPVIDIIFVSAAEDDAVGAFVVPAVDTGHRRSMATRFGRLTDTKQLHIILFARQILAEQTLRESTQAFKSPDKMRSNLVKEQSYDAIVRVWYPSVQITRQTQSGSPIAHKSPSI